MELALASALETSPAGGLEGLEGLGVDLSGPWGAEVWAVILTMIAITIMILILIDMLLLYYY